MKSLFAVLGDRVQHSLSPVLHTAAGQACGIDLAYVPVVCRDEAHFKRAVEALRVLGATGANVTIPYKHAAATVCDEITPTAQAIGAINTLTFGASTQGTNTDGPALVREFGRMDPQRLRRVQLLGAGGAARAAAWALREVGAREVFVCARRRAADLAESFQIQASSLRPIPEASLVISTLPGDPEIAESVLGAWVDPSARPAVYDLAYGGPTRRSPLVESAQSAGLEAADGRGMLVEQAALALSLWTGHDVEGIRRAMKAAIGMPLGDEPFDSNSSAD